jgi:hypothetical protein
MTNQDAENLTANLSAQIGKSVQNLKGFVMVVHDGRITSNSINMGAGETVDRLQNCIEIIMEKMKIKRQ